MSGNIFGVRTHFSVGQSVLKPKEIVKHAAELGHKALAICDDCTVAGMTEFVAACKAEEIDYIVGASLPIYRDAETREKGKPAYRVKAFVQTQQGIENLFELISIAYSKERFYYKPRLQLDDLLGLTEGLAFTTGDIDSLFACRDWEEQLEGLVTLSDSVYAEMIAVDQVYYKKVNSVAEKAISDFCIEAVVTRPTLYGENEDDVRDIGAAVSTNSDPNHPLAPKPATRNFSLLSPDDFDHLCELMDLECDYSQNIIESVEYKWQKQAMSLPKLATDEFAQLVSLCKTGWKERISAQVFGEGFDNTRLDEYKTRLKYELSIINKMGFSAYFLLVHYVVGYAKDNGIFVGPARGSAAGSLVAYLLKITDVDPLRFGLIFERFLNPDRLDYPDIDLDFMSSRRGEIVQHLIDKFGEEYVSGIANYNTLASASALRDVARVSKLSAQDYECSKLVPKEHGQSVDLEEAVQQVTAIEDFALKYPRQWRQSCALQGVIRATGQHAAGVVVAGDKIIKRGAVYGHREHNLVCWDKRVVEDWGLIKLDILGLSTLDIIKLAVEKIAAMGTTLDLWQISLDDPETLRVFEQGKTKGVFQFEGGMARNLCREIAVSGDFRFEDIVAINALNRPGPLEAGLTEKYVKIRQGKLNADYPHERTEDALEETEGVIVYQEQVMQIARDLSGFTMAEADKLRKAIGKKDADLMKTMKEQFVDGATDNGMFESDADMLWEAIEGFAAYSFNKSHAVAYSLISYQAAYLKAHYPGAFYAASMTILADDKVKLIAKEATDDGFTVMPPDINKSTHSFELVNDSVAGIHHLYSPLTAVRNVSAKVCAHILEVREEGGEFTSYDDFFKRVEAKRCNIRAKENLTKVGAFASIEPKQDSPLDPSRLRDQKELMGALAVADVKPDRRIDMSPSVLHQIEELYADIDAEGETALRPSHGKKPRFVVITDKPHFFELEEGKAFAKKSRKYIETAIRNAGLKPSDGYYTTLVKVEPEDKQPTKEEIALYGKYLKRELDILNPPLVIMAGTKAIRYLFPDSKGSAEDLSRTVEYDQDNDRNYLMCINPQMVYVKPEKQDLLNDVFVDVAALFDVVA